MFKIIKKDDPTHAQFAKFASENAGNFDYNGLAEALNGAGVGDILPFPYRKGKLASLRGGLEERALTNNTDFSVAGGHESNLADGTPDPESTFLAIVTKLTDKQAVLLVPKPRGRAVKKPAAAPAPVAAPAPAAAGKKK